MENCESVKQAYNSLLSTRNAKQTSTESNVMQDLARVCEQAARAGGEVLMRYRGKFEVREKAPADLVTEADVASQAAIRDLVLNEFPDHDFLGEEDDPSLTSNLNSEFTWVVDPLDGTTNYVHGLENYCVSVALQQKSDDGNRVVEGAIYDPVRDMCFRASRGGGAFCNGESIHVSDVNNLSASLVVASLPARVARESGEVNRFLEVMFNCQAIRRLGSAALNLCYVASGKLDAYWATSVKKWDVAAGLLLVEEAGGVVTGLAGQSFDIDDPKFIATSTRGLHQEMVDLFSRVEN